jgi:hypothetical protein
MCQSHHDDVTQPTTYNDKNASVLGRQVTIEWPIVRNAFNVCFCHGVSSQVNYVYIFDFSNINNYYYMENAN